MRMDRLPAIPLIASDPYFSIWCPADTLTGADTAHWCGQTKPLRGTAVIDGMAYRFLGLGDVPAMEAVCQRITPTATEAIFTAGGAQLTVRFTTPALVDDPDLLSTPVTPVDFALESADGEPHRVEVAFFASNAMCYDGDQKPLMLFDEYAKDGLAIAYCGQQYQKLLCHSGDHFTIDWGYLYLASSETVTASEDGLTFRWEAETVPGAPARAHALIGYDDVASILYFGTPCKAWYARNGRTLPDAMLDIHHRHRALLDACDALDARLLAAAERIGGAPYQRIISAAYRQTLAAHKLIQTPTGDMGLISKENDSNGCAGTTDISYPSIPLFLLECPALVNALCRHILEFASMPVWCAPYAPHDVGRYPIVSGQMYGVRIREGQRGKGFVPPPFYLFPPEKDAYEPKYQMPVEESGNMLIMLYAAARYTGDLTLVQKYGPLLERWAIYLREHGEDPGEQLCTDDFPGHLAHNVNLAAKAAVAIACYARLLAMLGEPCQDWADAARSMAESWLARAGDGESTSLTFGDERWSQKYNLVWDVVFGLGLMPQDLYRREVARYRAVQNVYGVPLDARATYGKADWALWSASMAPDRETFDALIAPIDRYLRETETRVPFSDLYDTVTGKSPGFIARSVVGGVFMPMLREMPPV